MSTFAYLHHSTWVNNEAQKYLHFILYNIVHILCTDQFWWYIPISWKDKKDVLKYISCICISRIRKLDCKNSNLRQLHGKYNKHSNTAAVTNYYYYIQVMRRWISGWPPHLQHVGWRRERMPCRTQECQPTQSVSILKNCSIHQWYVICISTMDWVQGWPSLSFTLD